MLCNNLTKEQIEKVNELIEADKDIFDYIFSLFPDLNRLTDAVKYDSENGVIHILKPIGIQPYVHE